MFIILAFNKSSIKKVLDRVWAIWYKITYHLSKVLFQLKILLVENFLLTTRYFCGKLFILKEVIILNKSP